MAYSLPQRIRMVDTSQHQAPPPPYACVTPPAPLAAMDSFFTLDEPRQHSMAWQITLGNRIKWLWILSPPPTRKLATAACDSNFLHKKLESLLKLIKRKTVFSSLSSFFCLKSLSIALTRKRNPDMSLVKGKFHLEVWRLRKNLSLHKSLRRPQGTPKVFTLKDFFSCFVLAV